MNRYYISNETREQIREALRGDSNDAEHDALVAIAVELGIRWTSCADVLEDD